MQQLRAEKECGSTRKAVGIAVRHGMVGHKKLLGLSGFFVFDVHFRITPCTDETMSL
jgi:hypothetical protein